MRRIWPGYVRLVETISVTGMIVMVIVAVLQVYYRYVVGQSLYWSEEVMRYLMIWIVSISAGLAYTRGQFMGMGMLVDIMPAAVRTVIDKINALLIIGFLLTVTWYGVLFAIRTQAQTAVALNISMFWVHGALALGTALLAIHVFLNNVLGLFKMPPRSAGQEDMI